MADDIFLKAPPWVTKFGDFKMAINLYPEKGLFIKTVNRV
jgi:hypothetical protein